ncbi:unnamed protein product [Rhizoctonia solani]|uniref:Transmembrane protein n=1 Tax=Rhizoctonia solani TaxID=456999 RepID=A0A8H2X607_9AGAM|nr:unnamed protein product [Rhizoctonia solani]
MLSYIVAVALFLVPAISVPSTSAVCVVHTWTLNSRGQNPCLVAAYLNAPCTPDNVIDVPSLGEGEGGITLSMHLRLTFVYATRWYGTFFRLVLYVKGEFPSGIWRQWRAPCLDNMVNVGKYPVSLPAGVSVPSWAYYDFTATGIFNHITASQQSGPESSAISGPTSTDSLAPTLVSTATGANGSTSIPNPNKSQSGSSSTTGAIIGGVVGGVLGIGLLGLIAFVIVRKRKPEAPAIKYPETSHKPPMTTAFDTATPIMVGQAPSHQFGDPSPPAATLEYKSYNASNPSTPTGAATPATGHYIESLSYPYQFQGARGQPPYPNSPQV